MEKHSDKLLSSNANGDYLQQQLQADAYSLMLVSPQYNKEKADSGGNVTHDRQKDLATTKRELLNKVIEDTGIKIRLKTVYMPMGKDLNNQSDDNIIKDIKNLLKITQDSARSNEKLENRVSRVTRKPKLTRGKIKPLIGEYYLNALTNTTTTRARPNTKQKIKPGVKLTLKDMCNTCKNKLGNAQYQMKP